MYIYKEHRYIFTFFFYIVTEIKECDDDARRDIEILNDAYMFFRYLRSQAK